MSDLKVKVMSFEEPYSDGSGVEFGVKYDSKYAGSEIQFECINKVEFPAHKLDWLIAALERIRSERNDTKESKR